MNLPFLCSLLLCFSPSLSANPQDCSFEEAAIDSIPEGYEVDGPIRWSPDGRRAAYVASKDGQLYPVVGSVVHESFDYVNAPSFSTDSAHVVFRVGNRLPKGKEKWWPLLDGKKTRRHDWIGDVNFLPGTEDLIYWTQPGARVERSGAYSRDKTVLRVGKKTGKKWKDSTALFPFALSKDNPVAATAVSRGGMWHILLATKKSQKVAKVGFPLMNTFTISPNGKLWAASVSQVDPNWNGGGGGSPPPPPGPGGPGGGSLPGMKDVVAVGEDILGADFDSAGAPVYGPKNRHVAYKFVKDSKMGVAIDRGEKAEAEFDYVYEPVFSPDGKLVAFAANEGGNFEPLFRWMPGADESVRGGTSQVIRLDKEGRIDYRSEPFEAVSNITFSPKAKRLAWCAKVDEGWIVICGKSRSQPFDDIGPLNFDPKGKTIAFGVRKDRELLWKVLELEAK